MIAIDTNILLRYFVQDDVHQADLAEKLLTERLTESEPGLVTAIALIEMIWVLEGSYGVRQELVAEIVRELLASPVIVVEHARAVEDAIAKDRGDFADRLIHRMGLAQGCFRTLTFDRRFARTEGVELLA